MKLSTQEQNIIACVQHRSDLPLSRIAQLTGLKEHAVRYSMKKLIDENVIVRRALINIYKLGFSKHAFFFSLAVTQAAAREKVLSYLRNHPRIAYIAEVGGDFRFKVDICTQTQSELRDFITDFSEKFGDILRNKAFVQLLEQVEFTVRCQTGKPFECIPLRIGTDAMNETIDDVDHRILGAVSEIAELTPSQIARQLGMAQSSLQYRLKNLTDRGIIVGYRYIVNGAALHLNDFFHLIYARGMREDTWSKLLKFCKTQKAVRYLVACIGSWDFEIGSNVESMEQAAELSDQLYEVCGDSMQRIQTLPLFRFTKVSNYPLT
jgi:DNA-binding Lrp family transcriptional regulator